jgi:hypothetical protein
MIKLISLLTLVIAALAQPVKSPEIWTTPIPDFENRHFPNYVLPASKWGAGHRGIDLLVEDQEQIKSPFDGIVHFEGKVVDRNVLTLKSSSGLLASFEPICSNLIAGDEVTQGEQVGHYCSGTENYEEHCEMCIHFSVRSEHGYLNPLLFVSSIRPSVIVS